ncbi:MAG: hypothetical protein ACLRMZ_20215 [Blautia marasmi]
MDTCQADALIRYSRKGFGRLLTHLQNRASEKVSGYWLCAQRGDEKGSWELLEAADIFLDKEWKEEWGANVASYSWLGRNRPSDKRL